MPPSESATVTADDDHQQGAARLPVWIVIVLFLIIAAPAAITFCFLTGPFQTPDEGAHFFRAVQVSSGHILPVVPKDHASAGGYVDRNAIVLVRLFNREVATRPYDAHPPSIRLWWSLYPAHAQAYAPFSNTAIYFPLAYLAPALVVSVLSTLHVPLMAWLYCGRLANCLVAIGLSCLALYKFAGARLFVFLTLCLPLSLFIAASFSADALLISFACLFGAMISKMLRRKTLTTLDFWILIAAMIFVCVNKIAYIPLSLIPAILAITQRRPKDEARVLFACTLLTVTLWLAWALTIGADVIPIRPPADHVVVSEQLSGVIHHPLSFAGVLFKTLLHDGPRELRTLVGSQLGWLDIKLPYLIVYPFVALVIVTSVFGVAWRPSMIDGLVVLFLIASSLFLVYLFLYLQYTPVHKPTIDGAQGRYLLPLVPIFAAVAPKFGGSVGRGLLFASLSVVVFSWCVVGDLTALIMVRAHYWP